MKHRISFIVAISLLGFGHDAAGQRDYSKVTVKSTHLAGAVHMLEGSGGHIGVSAGPDGILIVDMMLPKATEEKWQAAKY